MADPGSGPARKIGALFGGSELTEPSAVEKVHQICMELPEVEEKSFGGHTAPTFRIRDKIFVMTSEDLTTITFKARPGVQQALVESEPERFFVPKYVGHQGWVGARLDV